jgi:hypothetical protein
MGYALGVNDKDELLQVTRLAVHNVGITISDLTMDQNSRATILEPVPSGPNNRNSGRNCADICIVVMELESFNRNLYFDSD